MASSFTASGNVPGVTSKAKLGSTTSLTTSEKSDSGGYKLSNGQTAQGPAKPSYGNGLIGPPAPTPAQRFMSSPTSTGSSSSSSSNKNRSSSNSSSSNSSGSSSATDYSSFMSKPGSSSSNKSSSSSSNLSTTQKLSQDATKPYYAKDATSPAYYGTEFNPVPGNSNIGETEYEKYRNALKEARAEQRAMGGSGFDIVSVTTKEGTTFRSSRSAGKEYTQGGSRGGIDTHRGATPKGESGGEKSQIILSSTAGANKSKAVNLAIEQGLKERQTEELYINTYNKNVLNEQRNQRLQNEKQKNFNNFNNLNNSSFGSTNLGTKTTGKSNISNNILFNNNSLQRTQGTQKEKWSQRLSGLLEYSVSYAKGAYKTSKAFIETKGKPKTVLGSITGIDVSLFNKKINEQQYQKSKLLLSDPDVQTFGITTISAGVLSALPLAVTKGVSVISTGVAGYSLAKNPNPKEQGKFVFVAATSALPFLKTKSVTTSKSLGGVSENIAAFSKRSIAERTTEIPLGQEPLFKSLSKSKSDILLSSTETVGKKKYNVLTAFKEVPGKAQSYSYEGQTIGGMESTFRPVRQARQQVGSEKIIQTKLRPGRTPETTVRGSFQIFQDEGVIKGLAKTQSITRQPSRLVPGTNKKPFLIQETITALESRKIEQDSFMSQTFSRNTQALTSRKYPKGFSILENKALVSEQDLAKVGNKNTFGVFTTKKYADIESGPTKLTLLSESGSVKFLNNKRQMAKPFIKAEPQQQTKTIIEAAADRQQTVNEQSTLSKLQTRMASEQLKRSSLVEQLKAPTKRPFVRTTTATSPLVPRTISTSASALLFGSTATKSFKFGQSNSNILKQPTATSSSTKPKSALGSSSLLRSAQRQLSSQRTKQLLRTPETTSSGNGFGLPSSFNWPTLPTIPNAGGGWGGNSKSKTKVTQQKIYTPTLFAISFNIKAKQTAKQLARKTFTGFETRGYVESEAKKNFGKATLLQDFKFAKPSKLMRGLLS